MQAWWAEETSLKKNIKKLTVQKYLRFCIYKYIYIKKKIYSTIGENERFLNSIMHWNELIDFFLYIYINVFNILWYIFKYIKKLNITFLKKWKIFFFCNSTSVLYTSRSTDFKRHGTKSKTSWHAHIWAVLPRHKIFCTDNKTHGRKRAAWQYCSLLWNISRLWITYSDWSDVYRWKFTFVKWNTDR